MKKTIIKRIVWWSASVFLFLAVVLAVHIYLVTRPKAPDKFTVVLARIDFKQAINKEDAARVTQWLYAQEGVDHATCNPDTRLAVFTYHPVKLTGTQIMNKFKTELHYNAVRYVPSPEEMKSGCPVASTSAVYRIYNYFKNKF